MNPSRHRSSVFIRYALSYTAVVLVLFSFIMGYLYFLTSRQTRDDIIANQINRLTRIASQHETYLSTMLNTAEEIGLSPHIEPFNYASTPWKAYDLQLQLIPYTSTNPFCDQVYLHFTGEDRMYSSSSSMTVELFTSMMQYEKVSKQELYSRILYTDRMAFLPDQHVTSTLVDGGSPSLITFIVPLGANPGTSKGTMLYLVKDSVYQNLFSDAIGWNTNTYIFQEDTVLSCSESLPFPASLASTITETGTTKWNGEAWTLISLPGKMLGLRYVSVLRDADIRNSVIERLWATTAILPVFVLFSLALALFMARSHAKPIVALSDLLTSPDSPPPQDEIQRISSGIRQLTHRNQELASRLDLALPMQRHSFVFQFMKGRFSSYEEAVSVGNALNLEVQKPYYAVILCNNPDKDEHPLELTHPPFSSLSGISGCGVELVALKALLYLVFADDAATLPAVAEMLRKEMESDNERCITAISAVHRDYTEAPSAYLEAASAYDNRFVMGTNHVLSYESISSNVEGILPKAEKITNSISQALALGNHALLNDRLDELLSFLKNTSMSPFAFRMIYNHVIDTLARNHAVALANGKTAREFTDIFSLSSCQSIDDLDELLRSLCDSLLSVPEETEMSAEDDIDQVVRYIQENYCDPEISMTAIAESFEMSTPRLSSSFKEKMGMTPLDYLTLLRAERAKDLLVTTELTIREVSAAVGYYDSGSFTRRFKQLTGETPLQYRRNHS